MNKSDLRNRLFLFLGAFDSNIKTKFLNICGKTGQYNVPNELFQKRTSRTNRALISWKSVVNNGLTLSQLETFDGGVVVEFINEDYFDPINQENLLFQTLKTRLGSDEIVSSMISIRSEGGSSSSAIPRESLYKLKEIFPDYENHIIKRNSGFADSNTGKGNEKWSGFIYISIRGGQQDTIETHTSSTAYQLFNPACEYANKSICLDIDLVMSYFAMHSIDQELLTEIQKSEYDLLIKELIKTLKTAEYNNDSFVGNLLDYCTNHPSIKMIEGMLYDPIQVEEIRIEDFSVTDKSDLKNLDFTHDEPVNHDRFYYDTINKCILSPARPTNIFWSRHLSNMMQQNFSLNEYFEHEEIIVERRKKLLESS